MRYRLTNIALRTSLIYGVVASLWILLSDRILDTLAPDPKQNAVLQTYKGWAFVALTAVLLYGVLRREMRQWEYEALKRGQAEQALEAERAELARRVAERTADLSVANAELARAARLKDEFLASMSHELRTPLNSILGRAEALQEQIYGSLTPKQIEMLRGVEESGRHLLALINDILDLSKIEADKLELQIEPIMVDPLCRASLRMVTQTALQRRVGITTAIDPQVEFIGADERRLKQILVNLLSNAVKFTPEGGKVGLEVQGDPEQQTATFTVWDTGIGIAERDLPRLFKPFIQIDSSLSRQSAGSGLGLALVHRLAQAHRGSVAVASAPGQGSRFSVTLPWNPDGSAADPAPDSFGAERPNLGIRTVLVIEDSTTAADQAARYLAELGAQVQVIAQGAPAAERALELQPDLIVLDILLPDLHGWEVLRRLKAEPRTRACPVVIVSVVDEPERAREHGAAAFLLKPLDRARLLRALQQIFQAGAEPAPQPAAAPATRATRILVAEDNQANIDVLQDYLRSKGFEVLVARNGDEALERAHEAAPALILMDIQMPGMDGLEAIRRLRANAQLHAIPIIALTALAMPGDRQRCLAAGADEYMTKPVNLRALQALIELHLRRSEPPATS